jgi:hypothetical protein
MGAFQANHLGNCEGRLLRLQDNLHSYGLSMGYELILQFCHDTWTQFSGHSHFS